LGDSPAFLNVQIPYGPAKPKASRTGIPASDAAVCVVQKMEQKWALSERSEFRPFPIFCTTQTGTRRAAAARSPFLGYLFWRSKKGNWPPGHSRQQSLLKETTNSTTAKRDKQKKRGIL